MSSTFPIDFTALFDASPNPYLVLDRRLHIAAANRAYLQRTGRELSDIVGRWAWDAFPTDPETLKQAIASFERVIATKQPDTMALLRFDIPRPEAEGGGFEKRYWSLVHSPTFGPDGEVTHVIQHALDVTELEQLKEVAEAAGMSPHLEPAQAGIFERARSVFGTNLRLQSEHDRQQAMLRQMPGFAAMLSGPEHRYEYVNDAYVALAGYREFVGRTVREAFPDIEGQGFYELLDQVYVSGETFTGRAMPIRLEGDESDRFIDLSYTSVRDENGKVSGIFVGGYDVTERIRAGQALRESGERWQALAAASSDVLYRMSPDWGEMKELSGGDFLTNTNDPSRAWLMDYIPAEDQALVTATIEEAIRTKNMFELEHRVRQADGGIGWTFSRAVPLLDESGRIREWFGAATDITERRRAEDNLRELNQTLEQRVEERTAERDRIWQNSRDMLLITDPNGVWLSVSPACTAVLGWTREELEGRTSEWIEHPDDWQKSRDETQKLARGSETQAFENRLRATSGEYRHLSWTAVPEGDRFYCVGRDVTEEKAKAAALRLFENIVESDAAPVVAWDADFRLIAFNRAHSDAYLRVYGIEQRVGDSFLEQFVPEQAEIVRGFMARALSGETFTVRQEFGDPALEKPSWEIAYAPLRDESGRIIGAFHHAKDISAEVRAAAELASTQEALRQSQKLEAIGQLTGGVAHDFNNLLTVIRGSIDLMRRGTLPEERRQRHMQAISDTVTRATRLTQQLLAFARRQSLQPEVINVGKSMRTVSEMLATLSGSRVEIIPYTPAEPCFVNVDPSQFDTALVNMAVNARDAMEGEGTLTIRVKPVSVMPSIRNHPAVYGEFVAVSLTDTGSGIPADQLEHIFEPFFTTKAAGAGTGLGLSQVFGFAKQSGGEVMVESVVGKGTTFTLYLPRAEPQAETKEPAVEEEAVEGNGACVLLVEDNEEVGSFATQALIDLGYVAVWALNAVEALAELQKDAGRFDVVFSDVIMPGMNGIDLAQEIRRRHPSLPVVLTSGYSGVLAQGGTHGFELVHKPYSVEGMSRALGRAAGRSRPPGR